MTTDKLAGVHPRLAGIVREILDEMAALGHPMGVTDGLRTTEQQRTLFAKGRTAPGPIVTQADGIYKRSNHQAKSDGFGHAVDCAFLMGGKFSWEDAHPWATYGKIAIGHGLTWGGMWQAFPDRPHIELP